MNKLAAAGLTPTETKVYLELLENGQSKPANLARSVNITRTNCYKVLDSLLNMNLVKRNEASKTYIYEAVHPSELIKLEKARHAQLQEEQSLLSSSLPHLMERYLQSYEQPGIEHFFGKEGIRKIYEDQVSDGRTIFFISATQGIDFYGLGEMSEIRRRPARSGIKRFGIVPTNKYAAEGYENSDRSTNLTRTWVDSNHYKSPVEWGSYGNKLYMISYGSEAVGMVIENEHIAASFRELFKLLDAGIRRDPCYLDLGPIGA